MNTNKNETFKPFHYTDEGERFFRKIIEKYGLKEDIEHLIIPLINESGEEKDVFILKTRKMALEDGKSVKSINIDDYVSQVLEDAAEDGFSLKKNDAQEKDVA